MSFSIGLLLSRKSILQILVSQDRPKQPADLYFTMYNVWRGFEFQIQCPYYYRCSFSHSLPYYYLLTYGILLKYSRYRRGCDLTSSRPSSVKQNPEKRNICVF